MNVMIIFVVLINQMRGVIHMMDVDSQLQLRDNADNLICNNDICTDDLCCISPPSSATSS